MNFLSVSVGGDNNVLEMKETLGLKPGINGVPWIVDPQ